MRNSASGLGAAPDPQKGKEVKRLCNWMVRELVVNASNKIRRWLTSLRDLLLRPGLNGHSREVRAILMFASLGNDPSPPATT